MHAAQAAPKRTAVAVEEAAEEELEDGGQLEDWDEDAEGQEEDGMQEGPDPEEAMPPGVHGDGATNGLLNGRLRLPKVIQG